MGIGTILLIILIILLIGAFPSWPYSSGWGYGPSGLLERDRRRPADPGVDGAVIASRAASAAARLGPAVAGAASGSSGPGWRG